MPKTIRPTHGKRGRPPKFGRPSRVVALTLPEEVIRGLRRIDADLAWAVVTLFENESPRAAASTVVPRPDAELVTIADRRFLIVVNREVFRSLPGISIIPIGGTQAFLALEPGRGLADLELAVVDRLEGAAIEPRERMALAWLRAHLRKWRRDRTLRFHTRAIIVVERVRRPRGATRG